MKLQVVALMIAIHVSIKIFKSCRFALLIIHTWKTFHYILYYGWRCILANYRFTHCFSLLEEQESNEVISWSLISWKICWLFRSKLTVGVIIEIFACSQQHAPVICMCFIQNLFISSFTFVAYHFSRAPIKSSVWNDAFSSSMSMVSFDDGCFFDVTGNVCCHWWW